MPFIFRILPSFSHLLDPGDIGLRFSNFVLSGSKAVPKRPSITMPLPPPLRRMTSLCPVRLSASSLACSTLSRDEWDRRTKIRSRIVWPDSELAWES